METKDNSWYERGELPPAGTVCEYAVGTGSLGFKWCFFIGRNYSGSLLLEHNDAQLKSFHRGQIKLRPLRTEREKVIEAALSVMLTSTISNTQHKTINKLYDAGLLRLPESK